MSSLESELQALGPFAAAAPASGTWTIGPLTLTGDYRPIIATAPEDKLPGTLLKTLNVLGGKSGKPALESLPASISGLGTQGRRWLLYALTLMLTNADTLPAFDYVTAATWLAANVAESGRAKALDATEFYFEFQVLGETGWLAAAMRGLPALTQDDRNAIWTYYGQTGSALSESTSPPLKPGILQELKEPFLGYVKNQLKIWPHAKDAERPDNEPLERLGLLANWIQFAMWRGFEPHLAARTDSAYVKGFTYSEKLYDKTLISPAEKDILGYIRQRLHNVGADNTGGASILSRANFDTRRNDDHVALAQIAEEWLAENKSGRRAIEFLVRHVGETAHDGSRVGMVTRFPGDRSQASWRWDNIRTLIHELGHVLMHPRLLQAARESVPRRQVVLEGFVEVMTRDLYNKIVDTMYDELKDDLMLGIKDPEDPQHTGLRYRDNGVAAGKIYEIVGHDRFFMAFFNGDIDYVGLTLAT